MDQPHNWPAVEAQTIEEHDQPAEPARKRRSILQRILTGLGAGIVVIALIFMPGGTLPGLPFALAVALLSLIGASEFYRAVRRQGGEPSEAVGYISCVLFQIVAWRRAGSFLDPYLPAFLTLLLLTMMLVELIKPKQKPILNMGATLLGGIYCGWLFSFIVLLHGTDISGVKSPIAGTLPGAWVALFVIAVTSFNDVGGLFVGNALGKRKLAPAISPAKTWEGAVGGVAFATLVAVALGFWIKLPIGIAATLGVILAISGLIGDLCESALKRELGVKDFGVLLPGHGGVLDRIDSLLFAAPVAYYFLLLTSHLPH